MDSRQTTSSAQEGPTADPQLTDLARATRDAIRHSVHMMRLLDETSELTTSQLGTLNTLADESISPITITRLAQLKGVSQPTMTQHINRLEKLSLVSRTRIGEDRRSSYVMITPAGAEAAQAAGVRRDAEIAKELELLRPEELELLRGALPVLRRVAENYVQSQRS